jgi:hypothetical protein
MIRRLAAWSADPDVILFSLLGLLGVAIVTILLLVDDDRRDACRQRGGRVEEFQRNVMLTQSCGSNCWYTVPISTTDWRCVDK